MSWLKKSEKAKFEQQKREEDLWRQREIEIRQKEDELREKWTKVSLQVMQLFEIWRRLDCDRIITDIQKHVLGGELSPLQVIDNNVEITPTGWFFGDKKAEDLTEAFLRSHFKPDNLAIYIKRYIYVTKQGRTDMRTHYDYWKKVEPIFTLTIDKNNVSCDDKVLGNLYEIQNPTILESRIDEILSSRFTS